METGLSGQTLSASAASELRRDLAGIAGQVNGLSVTVATYETVVRRSLAEQEVNNRLFREALDRQDARLRDLEQQAAVMRERVPEPMLDNAEIKTRFDRLETRVNRISVTVARWGGIAAMGIIAVEILVKWVAR